ncbi:26S proteasome non-ATPase regulatory subunit [Entomortierella chlamydospora]|uniref:26S proteasome non-ATPase regulatory subunit n=1 Tax=Entomortierella chlamydospora TaxID=101097 RepID=A0A9P6MSF1_9FUNG|nr:26S proteasome non-ATPase regulatory subunit [Entomortierella chlamydospora]KAG0011296.1 26S proteasome non-ATPase regulatory subunit [Entomortierella chlamydospora]
MSDAPRRSTRLNKNQEEEKAKAKAVDQDVEMEESPAGSSTDAPKEKVLGAKELEALVIADIKQHFVLFTKSAKTHEARFAIRALRSVSSLRKRLTAQALAKSIVGSYGKDDEARKRLLVYLGSEALTSITPEDEAVVSKYDTPEVDVYLHLLVMIYLLDKGQLEKGIELSNITIKVVQELNRRSLDQLAAKVYFYYARFYELTGRLAEIRPTLLNAQRTATLRRDDDTQSTLINLLLRNYFHYNLYDQADKLVSKITFPENATNNQLARYMYYLGRIKAIQLEYTESHQCLLQAVRKAPQNNVTAGFQQEANKLLIIVQLLMGEIPERSLFRQPVLRKALIPYFQITQAVRVGDLNKFQETLATHAATFNADKNYTLILRLRHNVIKTGIRMISLSYSRISLRDVCLKLHLDSEEDAEYIVAKSIRDGVIDATIDHEKGFMRSKENVDIYSTNEPQHAFHQRIGFCLKLHNDSVKAMRFPLKTVNQDAAEVEAARDQERTLVQEIAEADEDMDEDHDEL